MSPPPSDLIIRPCRRDELAVVLELWTESRSPYATTRDDLEALERLIEHDPSSLLIAERGAGLIGTVVAAWDGWRGNMYRLAVAFEEVAPAWASHSFALARLICARAAPPSHGARRR